MCTAVTPSGARFPVLVEWMDVRAVMCARHQLLLSYSPCRNALP